MGFPKITIYGSKLSPSTQRVLILLEELQLNYKLHEINLENGELQSKEFIKLNPFSQVPVLKYQETIDSTEKILYQSRSILRYISNKHDSTVDYYPDSKCDMWVDIESQELYPVYRLEDKSKLSKVLKIYNDNLLENKFTSGESFTISDITCIPELLYIYKQDKEFLKNYTKLYNWFKKIKNRDSVKQIFI